MAKSRIQFQKGMSFGEFLESYGTEDQCRKAVFRMRWPEGFRCPKCGGERCCLIKTRGSYQCSGCGYQASVISGTIFHSTKVPLTKWFLAIYLLTQGKKGVSTIELGRHLGVSQNTAWAMKHKLMHVMFERDKGKKLRGDIEADDSYLGGERRGGKRGRGSEGKIPFVVAVEKSEEGHPKRIKLQVLPGFRKKAVERWAKDHLEAGSCVTTDGLNCFRGVIGAGCSHQEIVVGEKRKSIDISEFNWVNTVLGNLKKTLSGTYHSMSPKHVQRYLSEFEYRFNRRYDLKGILPRLLYSSVRTKPMPLRMLTCAEYSW